MLRINRATLLFWTEAFREELGLPSAFHSHVRFEERHLRAMVGIHRMVLTDHRSLDEVRGWICKLLRREGDSHTTSGEHLPHGEIHQVIPEVNEPDVSSGYVTVEREPSDGVTEGKTAVEVAELSGRVAALKESVDYLTEENRALQELIGRLVHYVETLGEARNDRDRGHNREGWTNGNGTTSPGRTKSQETPCGRPPLSLSERRAQVTAQREAKRSEGHTCEAGMPSPNGHIVKGPNAAPAVETEPASRALRPWHPRAITAEERRYVINAGRIC